MVWPYVETTGTSGADQLSAGCGFVVLGLQGDDKITGVEGDNQLCLGGTGNNTFTAIPNDISMYVSVNGGHDTIVAPLFDLTNAADLWGTVDGKSLFFLEPNSPQGVIVINDYRTDTIDETFVFKNGTYRYSDLMALAKSGMAGHNYTGDVSWQGAYILANGLTVAENKEAWQYYASRDLQLEAGGTAPAGGSASGTAGNDVFTSTSANDTYDGAGGLDTAVYAGARSQYTVAGSGATVQVSDSVAGRDGTDVLTNVERVKFTDEILAFDVNGNAGEAYRMYQAAFARTPDTPGVSYWVSQVDKGMSLHDMAAAFIGSAEFKSIYGASPSIEALVTGFYTNVLGRAPDSGGSAYWVGQVQAGMSPADLLVNFSESTENKAHVGPAIQNGIDLALGYFT